MSIQAIIDSAQSIEIDRRRVVGQSVSRSQRIKSAERLTAQPFLITVTPTARLRYSSNRDTIEDIMTVDRMTESQVNLANVSGMRYLTEYQGQLNTSQLSGMTITNFTGTSVTLGGLPTTASTTYIFRKGDYIQPALSRYPYIVTEDLQRGTGSAVTATVHRNLITSEATTVTGAMLVGTATTMRVVISQLPTYKLILKDYVEFTGEFILSEKVI